MALRGHGDNEGNFYELLQLRANDIPELKEWLQRKRAWLTHDNQNEILELLALEVMRKLNNSIKEDEYFSLIVDGTTDVSTKEQVSLCIRHVNGDFEVSEDFIGLYETSSTTGETLTKIIQDVLLRLDLNIDNCRGQCYDGAGNMKGHMKGTQVRISKIEPRATYIHCFNHALNLAVIDATGAVPEFGNVLQNVHELGKYFNKSAKRTDIMLHHKSDDNLALTKNTKLKPLCPTRWTVRLKSLQAVNSQYETVLSALESIKTEDPDPTANAQVDRVKQRLTKLRTDEKFNELWEKVKKRGADMDLLPVTLPRVRAPPKRLEQKSDASPPVTFSGPETYLRKQYFDVLDNLKSDIDYRFQHPGVKIYKDIETVLMKAVNGKTEEVKIEVDNICDHFKTDLDKKKLTSQLNSLQDLPKKKEVKSVRDLVVTLNSEPQENKRFLSEVVKVVKLLLVLPASAATAERTFSCLRRLKTWLRSTMTQKRLNHLAILSVHRDIAKSIDDKHIARMFVNRVESRCAVFGNFKD
ncbi:zinc finger MYM-type protein 1-like [Macrosteles quadrilineatus]|uniref:zinc finger MYM-type protein 1-like n=1 Tax=Macrosteles quadrilineatus TaxID=74068 RepID=UPI0023E201EC|nr:zinc finger MYM-type protein 1-like [Macrosteles quadrilineatus]